MGMFDWITCEMPLPETPTKPPGFFQTKDLREWPQCERFTITADGRLRLDDGNAEWWNAVDTGQFTGSIQFYDLGPKGEWWEYRADFVDGKCETIELVEYDPRHRP